MSGCCPVNRGYWEKFASEDEGTTAKKQTPAQKSCEEILDNLKAFTSKPSNEPHVNE